MGGEQKSDFHGNVGYGMPQALMVESYCPGCGVPREQGAAICHCGYLFDRGAATVVGDEIVGTSPMLLPLGCAVCGRNARDGRRINKTLFTCPIWVVPILLLTLVGGLIAYLCARKQLQLSYSLCGECASALKTKKWIARGAWALLAAVVVASIGLGNKYLLIFAAVVFVAAVAASFIAQPPLRCGGQSQGVFRVKGAGRDFLAMSGRYAR
jgi:hypothetical protein